MEFNAELDESDDEAITHPSQQGEDPISVKSKL